MNNRTPIIIYALASALDAVSTAWCLQAGLHEFNPIIRWVIAQIGDPVIAIMTAKAVCLAALMTFAWIRKWPQRVKNWAVIGTSAFGFVAGISNLLKLL